ncbi:MAG: SRPBCC family protein [Deltaproteobacteria bacterium]|nr:SRPBCC family protein [Deltaproteobacteria bacterium]
MKNIRVTHQISVPVTEAKALDFLWNLNNLAKYEPKVTSAKATAATAKTGSYRVRGFFAGVPWGGRFDFTLNERGFTSESTKLPFGLKVSGGFVVQAETKKRCLISHHEEYELPRLLSPLAPFLKVYLEAAIRREMRNVRRQLI